MFTFRTERIVPLIMIVVMVGILALVSFMPNLPLPLRSVDAAVGDGTTATMNDYWNGTAEWVFLHKDTHASTGVAGFYNGGHIEVMSDGTWYYFNRKLTNNEFCTMSIQVRKSTDKGVTWNAPVVIVAPTAGTPYSCAATDGDAWYNPTENKWHLLFQCYDNVAWQGCALSRAGSDPMGSFTLEPTGGNPVITAGEIWNQICTDNTKGCYNIPGGANKVFDEGTFNIFKYDGTHYWVAFHGYDGVNGYRGIAKTTNFQTWIAGDSAQGVPNDAVFDRLDSQTWRESWDNNVSIGGGHGTMLQEGSYYYHLIEGADMNLACTFGQNWDFGLYRSTSLSSTNWSSFPLGNPIIYSSRAADDTNGQIPDCSVQYTDMFKDPIDNFIYMIYGRNSHTDANQDGLYFFRLEKSKNLLLNSDLWRSDSNSWNKTGANTNIAVYRFPGNTLDGTPYLATNCGGTCGSDNSIYQDVAIPGGTSGTLQFGAKFMSEGASGSLDLVVWQFDINSNLLQNDILSITTGTSWASFSKSASLLSATRTLRYQFYEKTSNLTYRADDMYLHTYASSSDTTAPATVSNLAVTSTTSSSAALTWTAPGDDGSTGTATSYDIRYSTSPITSVNWESATLATGEPVPKVAGTNQSVSVAGLKPNRTYYFAIKTSDEVPNVSGLSNVPSGTTPSLFSDNFDDNILGSAWSTYGGTWSETTQVLKQTSTANGDPQKAIISNGGLSKKVNYTITAKVRVDSWTDGDYARAGVSLFTSDGNGYNLVFHNNHSTVQFLDDGVAWGPSYSFTWTNGTWYWFKLKMDSGTLYGKVWQVGTAEPGTWPYSWARSGRTGYPALNGGSTGASGSSAASFDDVTVYLP